MFKYHFSGNQNDFTPSKIALVLGHGIYWEGFFVVSLTDSYLIVRGYSETVESLFAIAVERNRWSSRKDWKEVSVESNFLGEMRFSMVNGVDPGKFPDQKSENLWHSARDFAMMPQKSA